MKPRPEKFDLIMRQHLQETSQGAADWDIPSDKVWDAVAERIKPEKKRRWGLWWVLGGAGLMLTGALWFTLANGNAVDEKESHPIPATQILPKEGMTDSRTQLSEQIAPDPNAPEEVSQAQSDRMSKNDIPAGRNTTPSENRVNHAVAAEATHLHVIQNATSVVARSSGNSVMNFVGEETSGDAAATPVQSHELRIQIEVQFLNSPLTYLNRTEIPHTPDVRPSLISRPQQPGAWSLTALLSPSLGTRRIAVPADQPRVRRNLLLQQEEPAMQLGFGIAASHDINPRWSVSAGVEYGSYLLNSSSTHQIRYTHAGEMLNPQGNFENRFQLNLHTSYGELNTEVVVERSSDAQIEENKFIALNLETSHRLQELRFPLSVRYQIPIGNWRMSCYTGLSANVLLENQLTFRAVQSLNSEILKTRTLRKARMMGSRDMTLGYHFGIDMEMPLDRQWSIVFGPSLSGSLQPTFQNRHVRIYPAMVDMDLGVRYQF